MKKKNEENKKLLNIGKEQRRQAVKDIVRNKIEKIFSIETYINFLQNKIEPLIEIVMIDVVSFSMLFSILISVYFLIFRDWKMALSSVVVFSAIAFILDRMGENKNNKGDGR